MKDNISRARAAPARDVDVLWRTTRTRHRRKRVRVRRAMVLARTTYLRAKTTSRAARRATETRWAKAAACAADRKVRRKKIQEVIEGVVDQITEYGAFVRFGPLDGLLHVSQVQDDHINTDVGNQRLVGKESKRELRVGDKVRARVVTISLNEISPRESKIGLTMRQPGLGKHEWIVEDQNKAAAGGE